MQPQLKIDPEDREIAQMIANLGSASEIEIQARMLKPLKTLRIEIHKLEEEGLVRRRRDAFKGGYGDALELTELGYRTIR